MNDKLSALYLSLTESETIHEMEKISARCFSAGTGAWRFTAWFQLHPWSLLRFLFRLVGQAVQFFVDRLKPGFHPPLNLLPVISRIWEQLHELRD